MKRLLFVSAMALMVSATTVQGQEARSTTRIEAQHKPPSSMEKRLPEYEVNLLKTLGSQNPTVQAQAVQTIRDLEQMFPRYAFNALLSPLEAKLKDEKADTMVRHLAALALDELHSDAGDAVIREVASACQDKGVQTLCKALLVKSQYD
jgi:hypothetical protein